MSTTQAPLPPLGKVLVTGGCGFLGSHIVRLLLERYPRPTTSVAVLDLNTSRNTVPEASYHACDLSDQTALRKVFEEVKPDVVIHTASPLATGPKTSPKIMYKVNVDGTRLLIEESKRAGTGAFVYTSSASVSSDSRTDLINADERYPLVRGRLQKEYYSDTKAEAEEIVIAANNPSSRFLTSAIRPSGIFGEGDVQMVPAMLNVLRQGRTAFQLGDNENLFDFTYVGNIAYAHLLAAARLVSQLQGGVVVSAAGKVDGEAFIITNGTPIYFWDFARALWQKYYLLSTAAGRPIAPPAAITKTRMLSFGLAFIIAYISDTIMWLFSLPPLKLNAGGVRFSCMTRYYNPAKPAKALGYQPVWDLDQALDRTAKWFLERDLAEESKKSS